MKEALREVGLEHALQLKEAEQEALLKAARKRAGGGRPRGSAKPRSAERPVALQLKLATSMEDQVSGFSDLEEFFIAQSKRLGMSRREVKQLWQRKEILKTVQKKHRLSLNPAVSSAARGQRKTTQQKRYRGFRAPGAGRKDEFPGVLSDLKVWFESQRCHGHTVQKRHLLDQWKLLLSGELLRLQQSAESSKDALEQASLLKKVELGKKQLTVAMKDKGGNRLKQLLHKLQAVDLKPDLTTHLTAAEEAVRAKLTWQALDHALHKACFAPLEQLDKCVSKPAEFRDSAKDLVLLFSDQVPLWVKSGPERSLFARWEKEPYSTELLRQHLKQQQEDSLVEGSGPQPLLRAELPSVEKASKSGQKQKRSLADADASRFRVTYEARQALYGLCSDSGSPLFGKVLPGLLVVHGAHARLSNIDSSGKFISDESFEFQGRLVVRKAGSSAGRLLLGWRKARDSAPETLRHLSVMSQPSANVDAVIFCWAQAELAALAPAATHQRDCFAAAWSPSASEALFVSNHLQVCIGAKLTASLSQTWSRAFKALCRSEMESLRLAGQQALQKSGSTELWKSSHLDIAKTVVAAQSEMARRLDDKDWILQGLRRNGMLAYRQKLVPLSDDDCGGQAMGFLYSAQTFFFFLGSNNSSILPKTPTSDTRVSLRLWSHVCGLAGRQVSLASWQRPCGARLVSCGWRESCQRPGGVELLEPCKL